VNASIAAKRFDGRTALVTGAAKGLGAAIAGALARQGARVFLADLDLAAAEATARALRDDGADASALALDVADEAAWHRAVASIDSQAGALHVLVNNAGIISRHNIQGMPTDIWRRVLDINLTGAFLGMRLTAPLIARSGGGAMVNISSVAGLAAHPDPAYVASKWGLRGLTKTAAVEFAASGIRVNSVHPAMIMTELQHSAPPGYAEASSQAIPLGRAAEAEEVAAAVLFLACDESSFVTGTELVVDGGLIAGGVMRMRAHLQQQFAAGRGA
jgi:3alpha(or 20beta)-hydroxysteroid dehydrogenase